MLAFRGRIGNRDHPGWRSDPGLFVVLPDDADPGFMNDVLASALTKSMQVRRCCSRGQRGDETYIDRIVLVDGDEGVNIEYVGPCP